MPTTKVSCCWCGGVLDDGKCPLHTWDALAMEEASERLSLRPEWAAGVKEKRVLKCMKCGKMLHTTEDGEHPCCAQPMLEAQWGTANSEAEDVRVILHHVERTQAWRRAAILAAIAASLGWLLLIGEWLR